MLFAAAGVKVNDEIERLGVLREMREGPRSVVLEYLEGVGRQSADDAAVNICDSYLHCDEVRARPEHRTL